jgi:formylmethanofuran dehydrogenase subunit B
LVLAGSGVDTRGCARAAAGFARAIHGAEHRVSGRAASLDEAARAAAAILAHARLPLVTGRGADVAGWRALLALADRAGAVVDRWQGDAQTSNQAVIQDSGAFAGTFGEIANRADVVLLIGGDPGRDFPRLCERLLRHPTPLYRTGEPWTAFLGPDTGVPSDHVFAERHIVPAGGMLDALSALSAIAGGRRPRATDIAGLSLAALEAVAARLKQARYGAIIWNAATFPTADAEIAARLVLQILRALNRDTRAVSLPLGGSDNAQGASQVMLWQCGWPGRISFAHGAPNHDPWRYRAERLLSAGETDALLWVAAITPQAPPPARVPTVALVTVDTELALEPSVVIRVGVPGLDHGGAIVRADNVIALPLAATRTSALPSVAAAARAIFEQLSAEAR